MMDARQGMSASHVRSALLVASVLLMASPSSATYSVVGVHPARREVGAAGASCIGGQDVYIIYGSVPGTGVVVAQATFHQPGRDRAVALLEQGLSPSEVTAALTAPSFDPDANVRQYAVADVSANAAAFTGAETQTFAADQQGERDGFVYSVQGNLLTGASVLEQAAAGFEVGGCDLAERLLVALEAGAEGGNGDRRCTPSGIPSDSAFLQVDRDGEAAGTYLSLRVPNSGSESPLPELRARFTDWRETHPCLSDDSATGGDGDAPSIGSGGRTFDEAPADAVGCS